MCADIRRVCIKHGRTYFSRVAPQTRLHGHASTRICSRAFVHERECHPSLRRIAQTTGAREREREGGKLVSPSPSLRRPSSPVPGTDPSIRKFAVLSRGRICSCAMREESAGSSISLSHSRGRGDDILPCHVTRGIISETARIVRA